MSRKIEVNPEVGEVMAIRRHGKRRWLTWPPETQAVRRKAIVEAIEEVKRAEAEVERRQVKRAV